MVCVNGWRENKTDEMAKGKEVGCRSSTEELKWIEHQIAVAKVELLEAHNTLARSNFTTFEKTLIDLKRRKEKQLDQLTQKKDDMLQSQDALSQNNVCHCKQDDTLCRSIDRKGRSKFVVYEGSDKFNCKVNVQDV